MAKKQKGINPDLEQAISDMLKAVMVDPTASITDKTKVIDRALKLEAIKLKMSDDEWGAGFANVDEEDEQGQTMVFVNHKGDKHGRYCFGTPSVRGHYRQAHHDFGSNFDQHHVWVDNVESHMGACDHTSDIYSFQLSSSKSQRKDFK